MCMTVIGKDGKLHCYGGNEVELVGKIGDKKATPRSHEEIMKSVSERVKEVAGNTWKIKKYDKTYFNDTIH